MNRRRRIRVTAARFAPERCRAPRLPLRIDSALLSERVGVDHCLPAIRADGIKGDRLATDTRGIVAANSSGKREQLPELDPGLARIGERERLRRKILWRENLLIEP